LGPLSYRIGVLGTLLEAARLAEVDKVEDDLPEAGPPKTDGGVEEALPDSAVYANSVRDLGNIGPSGLIHG
jgi:hypothetical protein